MKWFLIIALCALGCHGLYQILFIELPSGTAYSIIRNEVSHVHRSQDAVGFWMDVASDFVMVVVCFAVSAYAFFGKLKNNR